MSICMCRCAFLSVCVCVCLSSAWSCHSASSDSMMVKFQIQLIVLELHRTLKWLAKIQFVHCFSGVLSWCVNFNRCKVMLKHWGEKSEPIASSSIKLYILYRFWHIAKCSWHGVVQRSNNMQSDTCPHTHTFNLIFKWKSSEFRIVFVVLFVTIGIGVIGVVMSICPTQINKCNDCGQHRKMEKNVWQPWKSVWFHI